MIERIPGKGKNTVSAGKTQKTDRKGMLILISGPSGTGKGTLCERLVAQDKGIVFSVSATTRARRECEQEGVHYHFISEAEFDKLLKDNELLEHATVHEPPLWHSQTAGGSRAGKGP